MPPNGSTASSFLEGLAAGFARQDVSGAIREGRRIDEERAKKKEFENDVRDFQFSIGDSPSAKKSFQEMTKVNPGWDRDPEVFRKFTSNYHTLNDTNNGIDTAAQKGVFGPNPDPIVNMYKKMAITDPEGAGKLILSQTMGHMANMEKQQVAVKKAERENTINGLALQMKNSADPRAFEETLRAARLSDGEIFEIRKGAESFKDDPKGSADLGAQTLFDARRLNTPETIQEAANKLPEHERAAFIDEATKNMLTSQELAKIANDAQIEQQELLDVTDAMLDAGITSNSTDADIRKFMRDDETFKELKLKPAQLRLSLKVANKVKAIERRQKLARKSESSKERQALKGSGLKTENFSSDSIANNYVRFDPEEMRQTKVFSTDDNVLSSGFVRTPGVGSGSMMATQFADGVFVGADIPNLNGEPTYYEMEVNGKGDLVPAVGDDGVPINIPTDAAKESIRNMFFETTPEGENPLRKVSELVDDLMSEIKTRDDVTKQVDTGKITGRSRRKVLKTAPNPDSPHGLMLMQLKSLKSSLLSKPDSPRARVSVTDVDEDQNIENAVDAYLKYLELRTKLINTDSGVYDRRDK